MERSSAPFHFLWAGYYNSFMPRHFDYLLLGGGTSSGYAAAAIREVDVSGTIAILSADTEPPYEWSIGVPKRSIA